MFSITIQNDHGGRIFRLNHDEYKDAMKQIVSTINRCIGFVSIIEFKGTTVMLPYNLLAQSIITFEERVDV